MRILLSFLFFSIAGASLVAQSFDDALRFSENTAVGTARSLGTANSMSAIGADWTALQSNPAGLAAFRNNELTLTLGGILTGTSDATINAFTDQDVGSVMSSNNGSDFRVALPQLGLVLTRQPIASRWTQLNFGIGVSQTNRFEETIQFSGATPGSITDAFFETSNFTFEEDPVNGELFPVFNPATLDQLNAFTEGPAFDAGILIPADGSSAPNGYFTDYNDFGRTSDEDPGVALQKEGTITRQGYNSSFDLSFGGNFEEKLLVGVTLSLVNTSYEERSIYVEDDETNTIERFDNLRFIQINTHEGTGVNGKFGLIYRASQALRVGVSYHSPSAISVSDDLITDITYTSQTPGGPAVQGNGQSPVFDPLEYRFVSPSMYRASAAYIIGRRGFLSADVGYKNYPGGRFKIDDDPVSEQLLNDNIAAIAQAAIDARVGGELNLSPFKVRAGFEYIGAPVQGEDAALGFSGGIGFRQNRLSADLGYRLSVRPDRVYRPYNVSIIDFPQQQVNYTPTISTMALTVGWKLMPRLYEEEQPAKRKKRRGRRGRR